MKLKKKLYYLRDDIKLIFYKHKQRKIPRTNEYIKLHTKIIKKMEPLRYIPSNLDLTISGNIIKIVEEMIDVLKLNNIPPPFKVYLNTNVYIQALFNRIKDMSELDIIDNIDSIEKYNNNVLNKILINPFLTPIFPYIDNETGMIAVFSQKKFKKINAVVLAQNLKTNSISKKSIDPFKKQIENIKKK